MQDLPLVPPPMQVPQMAVRGNAFESLDFITEPLPPQIQPLARASHTVSLARISSARLSSYTQQLDKEAAAFSSCYGYGAGPSRLPSSTLHARLRRLEGDNYDSLKHQRYRPSQSQVPVQSSALPHGVPGAEDNALAQFARSGKLLLGKSTRVVGSGVSSTVGLAAKGILGTATLATVGITSLGKGTAVLATPALSTAGQVAQAGVSGVGKGLQGTVYLAKSGATNLGRGLHSVGSLAASPFQTSGPAVAGPPVPDKTSSPAAAGPPVPETSTMTKAPHSPSAVVAPPRRSQRASTTGSRSSSPSTYQSERQVSKEEKDAWAAAAAKSVRMKTTAQNEALAKEVRRVESEIAVLRGKKPSDANPTVSSAQSLVGEEMLMFEAIGEEMLLEAKVIVC